MRKSLFLWISIAFLTTSPVLLSAANGEKERKPDVTNTAELSFVLTSGNAVSSAYGFKNLFTSAWRKDTLSFQAAAVRAHATSVSRSAVGTPESYIVREKRERRLSAENYLVSGRYERALSRKALLSAGVSLDRNRFTGVENRWIFSVASGHVWADAERTKFTTRCGLTYTFRTYTGNVSANFLGVRAVGNLERKVGDNASFSSQLILDGNLTGLGDWRGDMVNSLAVAINKKMALKASLQWQFSNRPASEKIPLLDISGFNTGETVSYRLGKLDTFFTTSLVMNF